MKSNSDFFGATSVASEEPDEDKVMYNINQTFDVDHDAEIERLDHEEYDLNGSPGRR